MRLFIVLICMVLALPGLFASTPAPANPAGGRQSVALDGDWRWQLDPCGDITWQACAAMLPHADTVRLPVCWSDDARTRDYSGAVWYVHALSLPVLSAGAALQLVIDNPVGLFDLYLDGKVLTHGFGNGLTQRVPITGAAGSAHQLAIHLNATHLPDAIRQFAPGGIGPIRLEILPPVHFAVVVARYRPAGDALEISYRLTAPASCPVRLSFRLLTPQNKLPLARAVLVALNLPPGITEGKPLLLSLRHVAPWIAPDTKQVRTFLLVAEVTEGKTLLDQRQMEVGVCAVTANQSTLSLNGMPVAFRGLRLPGGVPPLTKATLGETYRSEFALLRQAGYNAIMSDATALPEDALQRADLLGVLVVAQVPLTETLVAGKLCPALDFARALDEQGHHPCIVAWSWTSLGDPAGEVAAFRQGDPARPALVRMNDGTRLFLPGSPDGWPITDLDLSAGDTLARQAEQLPQPFLLSGSPVQTDADLTTLGLGATERYYMAIRQMVESVRRAPHPLGYFIRPLRGGSLTGLVASDGTTDKMRAYFAAVSYNQPRLLALRMGADQKPEVMLINNAGIADVGTLTRLLIRPNGLTDIAHSETGDDEISLSGDRTQDLSRALPPFDTPDPGEYRLQYILSTGAKVIALSQVIVFQVGETPPIY